MTLPYMPLYVMDYANDTEHFPTVAHGAYLLLIMNYWKRQQPLKADDLVLRGIARLSASEWEEIRPYIAPMFREENGFWYHKRIDAEIERAAKKLEQVRAAGARSANRRSTDAERPFNDRSTTVPTDVRKDKVEDKDKEERKEENARERALPPSRFLEFWEAYPNKVNQPAAMRAWRQAIKREEPDKILAGLMRYRLKTDDRPWCNPDNWLNGDRWNDHVQSSLVVAGTGPPVIPGKVFVLRETPAWEAWEKFRGKKIFYFESKSHGGYGAFFESEWPPSQQQGAA